MSKPSAPNIKAVKDGDHWVARYYIGRVATKWTASGKTRMEACRNLSNRYRDAVWEKITKRSRGK